MLSMASAIIETVVEEVIEESVETVVEETVEETVEATVEETVEETVEQTVEQVRSAGRNFAGRYHLLLQREFSLNSAAISQLAHLSSIQQLGTIPSSSACMHASIKYSRRLNL